MNFVICVYIIQIVPRHTVNSSGILKLILDLDVTFSSHPGALLPSLAILAYHYVAVISFKLVVTEQLETVTFCTAMTDYESDVEITAFTEDLVMFKLLVEYFTGV